MKMKNRVSTKTMSILLAIVMLLGMLPMSVFAAEEPTEISIWPHIIKGTDATSLELAEGIDYEIAPLTSFTEEITLPGEVMESFITVGGERYDLAGFIMSEYDEATDTFSYSLSQTLTIAAEPAQGTAEWDEWYTPISDGLMAAYMLHTHNYVTKSDDSGHWTECSCEDKTTIEPHTYSDDTDITCDCGYMHRHVWGRWTSNYNKTHTRFCLTDRSHTETANCSDGDDDGELCDTCGYDLHTHSYTGILDATCDCGYNRGLFVTNDDGKDFFDVGFIPGDGVTLPDDAELVVEEHYPSLAPIASTIVKKTSLGDFRCPEEYDILTDEDAVEIHGIKCRLYETLMFAGLKYILWGSSQDGAVLIRFRDGRGMVYSRETGKFTDYPDSSFDRTVEQPANTTVTIDGVTYDVACIVNNSTYILYRDGQLAGMYPSTDDAADLHGSVQFYEGYDPETLKAQQDDNDLGSVTIPADYNNAAIADFAPGKTYKVSVIGSNDISVEGYDDALLNSITGDTPEIAAAKAEVERLKADLGARTTALTLMNINDPNYADAETAWIEASIAYAKAYTSLADLTNLQGATVTQTFKIPDALVGAKNVQYVGVHDTNPYAAQLAAAEQVMKSYEPGSADYSQAMNDYTLVKHRYDAWEKENGSGTEFGTVTLSLDGLTLTATHTGVRGFSPFIVYAFVEADELEYKELSATLHTEHTYENGKCTLCGAEDPVLSCSKDGACPMAKFNDLDTAAWYHDAIHYVLSAGLMCGMDDTSFLPDGITTRAQVVTILWRMAGEPAADYHMTFTDVEEGQWYTEAIRWAASADIVVGYDEKTFGPQDPVTREQIAVILWRYTGSPESHHSLSGYPDADAVSDYAKIAMAWANEKGMIHGHTDGTLDPRGNATRAQTAQILFHYADRMK